MGVSQLWIKTKTLRHYYQFDILKIAYQILKKENNVYTRAMSCLAISRKINRSIFFAESEKMYRNLVESVRNGIYMADANDTLFFVNQSFVEILGYQSKDEL